MNPVRVSRRAGLQVLGAVPQLQRIPAGPALSQDALAELDHALGTVRTHVIRVLQGRRPLLVTVTSPGPGDGKSLLSSSLALTLALAGYRTLLLDADLRSGQQHRRFGLNPVPGLSDFLTGTARLWEIVRDTPHANLSVVGCGHHTRGAADLLGSERMDALLRQLCATYHIILCDSPSLAVGVDPYVLCTLTGNLLVVLREGADSRDFPAATQHMLSRLPARFVGAVINAVPAQEPNAACA